MTMDKIVHTIADASGIRLQDRFGLSSPIPLIVIIALYLLTILKIAPSYMKSRPAFKLKTFMILYNIFQVWICIYLVYRIYVIDLPILQFWECVEIIHNTAEEQDFNHITVTSFWLKTIELSETVVFVLRKKQRQVSFLHVFHHCSTLFLVYKLSSSNLAGALYPLFLNCNVHIIMYCYYLMAAILPNNIVAQLTPFKKAITTIQMVQFAMILLQVAVAMSRGCNIPRTIVVMYVGIILTFFYLFYDFYKKNYNTRQSANEAKKKHESNKASDR